VTYIFSIFLILEKEPDEFHMGLQIIGWMDMEEMSGLVVTVYGEETWDLPLLAGQNYLLFVLDFSTQVLILMYYSLRIEIVLI